MSALAHAFEAHRRLLWGLSYRIVGVASEADEIVQETFVRALERRPADDRPLRPWLVRVAANLARDRLRRRRRRPYDGPWLPTPIVEPPDDRPPADVGLEVWERLGYGWLMALEALTPNQRVVLVLRDALDLSVQETADVLGLTPANVKVTLHRARRALADAEPGVDDPLPVGVDVVSRLVGALAAGDPAQVIALLADDVVAVTDGGGRYRAARNAVAGAYRVARLLLGLQRKFLALSVTRFELRPVGAHPAVVMGFQDPPRAFAPTNVTVFAVAGGRITRVWSVLADDKLAGAGV